MQVTIEGDSFQIPMKLLQVYQDIAVRIAVEKIIERPLDSDRFVVRVDGHSDEVVRKLETNYFSRLDSEEDTWKSVFSIISLVF